MWGPVPLPDWTDTDETWICHRGTKKKLLEGAIFMSGGAGPEPEETRVVDDDDSEPIFWHSRHRHQHIELIHTVKPVATIDLTPGDGWLAFQHIRHRIPIVVVCLTETHQSLLNERLETLVFHAMTDPASELHDATLSGSVADEAQNPKAPPAAKPKPPAKQPGPSQAKTKAPAPAPPPPKPKAPDSKPKGGTPDYLKAIETAIALKGGEGKAGPPPKKRRTADDPPEATDSDEDPDAEDEGLVA